MFRNLSKCLTVMTLALMLLAVPGVALASTITLDARQDAGEAPGEGDFLQFVFDSGGIHVVSPLPATAWTTKDQVYAYASGFTEGWLLHSAGNVWSQDKNTVGESLSGLHAGVYRISVVSGAFTYDSFDWSDYTPYLWHLDIDADLGLNGGIKYYSLDSAVTGSAALGFNAVPGGYLDISLTEGASLAFWINDWNSIDNAGGITFDVTAVPEPSILLLLAPGLFLLVRRVRR